MRTLVLPLLLALATPVWGEPSPAPPVSTATEAKPPAKPAASAPVVTLCEALEAASRRNGLPNAYFARLIWQESRFDPMAVSPKGAQGVAQFMPGTAAERGLANPFDTTRALDESAAYLKELNARFGNLGLAAAAYNAGPGRVGRWLAGHANLPAETIGYVEIVTGHTVFEWRGPFGDEAKGSVVKPPILDPEPGFSCLAFAGDAGRRRAPSYPMVAVEPEDPNAPRPKQWATILVGNFSKAAVVAQWQIMRAKFAETLGPLTPSFRRRHLGGMPAKKYVVQIETDDRAGSTRLCRQLEHEGGNCVVLRNLLR